MISSLPYATLEWRLGRILGDGSDEDLNPDYEDLQGQSVRIVPSIQGPLIYINGSGKKITVFLNPVDGVIGPNGELHAVGDVNLDNTVSVIDATLVQKQIVNLEQLSKVSLIKADVNHDGVIDVVDATEIQKIIVKLV